MSLNKISKYFTEDTLNEIISKVGGTKYVSYQFKSESNKKGDSYLSTVYRLKISGVNENNGQSIDVDVIVKAMISNLITRKLFRSNDFFRNEINFYTKIIPIFEEFQKKKNIKNSFVEYPKMLASYCDGENDFVVLQDVNVFGYKAPDRATSIDLEHCQIIMKTLGRFHAVSLALKDQEPELFKQIIDTTEEVYYADKFREWYNPFLKVAKYVAIDAVSQEFPGTKYEEITKKFLSDGLYDTLIDLVSTTNQYSVIGHGDCWRPNFLMKYEKNFPKDVIMIDFQLVRYASCALDITFFLYSCTDKDMRDKNYDKILKAYYDGISELIENLGSNPKIIFSFDALKSELKLYGKFGCGMGIESLPLTLLDDDEIVEVDKLNAEHAKLTDVWKIKPIKNRKHRQRIANCFRHAIDCEYIQ